MRYEYKLVDIDEIELPRAPKNKLQQESLLSLDQLNPIKLRLSKKDGVNKYELVDGRRRLTDLIAIGQKQVESLIEDIDNVASAVQALALNSGTPNKMDEALHIEVLINQGYKPEQISKTCNIPLQIVYNRIKLINLLPEIQELLLIGDKKICYSNALRLANLPFNIQSKVIGEKKITSSIVTNLIRGYQASKVGSSVLDIDQPESKPGLFLTGEQVEELLSSSLTVNYAGKSLILKVNETGKNDY